MKKSIEDLANDKTAQADLQNKPTKKQVPVKAGAAWISKKGHICLSLEELPVLPDKKTKIFLFKNDRKYTDVQPDYRAVVYVDEE